MIARGQSKAAQRARLALGCCPKHGVALHVMDVRGGSAHVECPRRDCLFASTVGLRSKTWRALNEGASS